MFFSLACLNVNADLPSDFPGLTVTTCDSNAVGAGYVFLEVTDSSTDGGYYVMMLKNDGTPVWYQNVGNHSYDFKTLPNGNLHCASVYHPHSWTDGGDCTHDILDNSYDVAETITAGNGYVADSHDFQLLPNGHMLLHGYYQTQIDLSRYAASASPNALVAGAVIQELDQERHVIFQWRSWDHFTIPTYFASAALTNSAMKNPVIDAFHLTAVVMDTDGNLLISNFGMDVWKISRQTGQVMWRLGGPANEFSFVGENPQQALGHFSGNTLSRLDNGNILIYCNADQHATRSSKVYEYNLDEANKVATLVWSYAPPTNCYAWHYGNAQRLANGNTFIGWGGAPSVPGIGGSSNQWIPACTEVTSNGTVVFQLAFNDPKMVSYRAYRFVYPSASQAMTGSVFAPAEGNFYDFDSTGVSILISSGGGGYSSVTLTREPCAPVNPQFVGPAPRVLPVRVSLTDSHIYELDGELDFDVASFGFADPASLMVYYRPSTGQGAFVPQEAAYNPVSGQVSVSLSMFSPYDDLGEFIFCYPDVTEAAYPPILAAVENYRGAQPYEVVGPLPAEPGTNYLVNQELPVCLAWSPQGMASGYHLQISTNVDFSDPIIDLTDRAEAFWVWSNAAPGSAYYYRVSTSNDGGSSDWSEGTFQTVPPMIEMPRITSIQQNQDGAWVLKWTSTSASVYVESNSTLASGQWRAIAGPVSGYAWTNAPSGAPAGFYRLRLP
jgi:hypothetical protein